MRLILVRHGESEGNSTGIAQGWDDSPLTDKGVRQAELVSDRLRDVKIDAVYSSDLVRAKKTAEIIARPHGLKVTVIKDLREQNFGDANGMPKNEVNRKFDNFLERRKTDPDAMVPNGESFRMVMERVKKALNEICERHGTGNVAVVLHGGSKRAAVWALGVIDMKASMSHTFGNTALTEVEITDGKAKIICLNCTRHISKDL